MDGKQLKNSILQWAIQGKLVPQNPKDEPAQKLLERIAASRNGGVSPWSEAIGSSKNSKKSLSTSLRGPCKGTKQSKNPPSRIYRENGVWYEQVGTAAPKDISDEIPFEIPENWAWCRLKDYLDVRDGTHDSPKYYSSGIPFVTSKNLVNGQIDFSNVKYISQEDHEAFSARSKVDDNDILFAMIGSIGNPVLVKKTCDFSIKNVALFKPYNEETDMHYMLLYFQHIQTGLKKIAAGGVQSFISLNVFRNWLFPLSPLAEQKRIVAKLEQVLPLAEEYGAAQEQLDKLNKELPEVLKKSILQEAIQGKLVPQNPKDEPASKLLERITLSRHSERSEESSKRSKKTSKDQSSRIYRENGVWYEQVGTATPKDISDEIPFEIPENWAWCRLESLCNIVNGFTPLRANKEYWENGDVSWFTVDDIHLQGRVIRHTNQHITRKALAKDSQRILPPKSILICCTASIGEYAITEIPLTTNQQFNGLVIKDALKELCLPEYLFEIAPTYKNFLLGKAGKTTFGFVSVKKLGSMLISLPPLAEQKRIVAKLEQLFKVL